MPLDFCGKVPKRYLQVFSVIETNLSIFYAILPKLKGKVLTVSFVSPKEISKINKQFRDIEKPTDVLSFTYDNEEMLGELYICMKEVKLNAKNLKNSIQSEIIEMIVHGLLHVAKYDHSNDMFALQDKYTNLLIKKYETSFRNRKSRGAIRE